ncbi:hypothetical protein Gorai_000268, partial [Gossypium raimondii]|nr:hypothetical protein [Gossypium raimondii]
MKSAYSRLIFKKVGFGPHRLFWKIIWKLQILPKILFVWRLSHDFLLKNVQISSIKQSFCKGCLKCSDDGDETTFHVLKECTKACAILALRGLNDLITILWNLWNSRNNAIFRGKNEDARAIWKWANVLGDDFRLSSSFPLLDKHHPLPLFHTLIHSSARQQKLITTKTFPNNLCAWKRDFFFKIGTEYTKAISSVVEKHGWQAFCLLLDDVFPQVLKEIYAHLSSPKNELSMCE